MSVNLSIKGVPDEWAERLRARAERNHRSLQGELMALVQKAAEEPLDATAPEFRRTSTARGTGSVVRRGTKTIEQIAAELRAKYPQPIIDAPLAVDIVRELRDGR